MRYFKNPSCKRNDKRLDTRLHQQETSRLKRARDSRVEVERLAENKQIMACRTNLPTTVHKLDLWISIAKLSPHFVSIWVQTWGVMSGAFFARHLCSVGSLLFFERERLHIMKTEA